MILQVKGCLDVITRILERIDDNDLLNMCSASVHLERLLSQAPPSQWRRRAAQYEAALVTRFLAHSGHVIDSLESYKEFIVELDKCLTCHSRPSLMVDYTSPALRHGPGTLPISPDIQFSSTHCFFYRHVAIEPVPDADGFMPLFAAPNVEEEPVLINIKSGAEQVVDEAMLAIDENYGANLPVGMFDPDNFEPTRVCLFNEHLIVWQPGLIFDNIRLAMIRPGQILFKMVSLSTMCLNSYRI